MASLSDRTRVTERRKFLTHTHSHTHARTHARTEWKTYVRTDGSGSDSIKHEAEYRNDGETENRTQSGDQREYLFK